MIGRLFLYPIITVIWGIIMIIIFDFGLKVAIPLILIWFAVIDWEKLYLKLKDNKKEVKK